MPDAETIAKNTVLLSFGEIGTMFTTATAAYAAANVALNLIIIPKYSYVGTGIAAVITQAIAAVTLYSFLIAVKEVGREELELVRKMIWGKEMATKKC